MDSSDESPLAPASCFLRKDGVAAGHPALVLGGLADRHAEKLARLLPLLACGEEAAALSFERLSDDRVFHAAAHYALAAIASEERLHDRLIAAMRSAVPPWVLSPATEQQARRLHLRIGRGEPVMVLARIAALDAAVCIVLNHITARHTPIARSSGFGRTLTRIRSDEARHVHATRSLVLAQGAFSRQALHEEAIWVRDGLASLLDTENEAFEVLGVDPGALQRAVRRVPDGLFRT